MKIKALLAFAALALLAPTLPAQTGVMLTPTREFQALVTRIQQKMNAGQDTEAGLKEEIAAYDALLAKYSSLKTEEMAQIVYTRAILHGQVLGDVEKAKVYLKQVQTDFPTTQVAAEVPQTLASMERAAQAKATQATLVGSPAPELHFKWTSAGDFKTLSALKGKVVVLDFWATWCGPCVATFPQIRELVAHYKNSDVAIVGVTSIQGQIMGLQPAVINVKGDPAKEMALMRDYIKAKDMTWTVAFSEEEVFNPDYGITGIPHMAIIDPTGKVRHTGLHPGMPHEEKLRMIDALLKEFGKPVPATKAAP